MHEEFKSVSYDLLCISEMKHTHSYLSKRFNSLYQTEADYNPRRQETQGQSPVEAPYIVKSAGQRQNAATVTNTEFSIL